MMTRKESACDLWELEFLESAWAYAPEGDGPSLFPGLLWTVKAGSRSLRRNRLADLGLQDFRLWLACCLLSPPFPLPLSPPPLPEGCSSHRGSFLSRAVSCGVRVFSWKWRERSQLLCWGAGAWGVLGRPRCQGILGL